MKGFLKGLRYFTHMFEEEKEPEIQIGAPTDVKHVAHIGWDGPSSVETPSWMKEFKASAGLEQSSGGNARGNRSRDIPDMPKSSRHVSQDPYSQSPSRETSSSKPKQSKRMQSKVSSDGSKSSMDPEQRNPTEKRSRRKKSKESINVGPSKSSRSKGNANSRDSSSSTIQQNPYPDLGPPGQPILGSNKDNIDIYHNSSPSNPIYTTAGRGRINEDKW